MRHIFIGVLILIFAFGCVQRPAPVANDTTPVAPDLQPAIAVEYVAVPSMKVYAKPDLTAEQTGAYGLAEAISILEKKNDWCRIRTFDGTGWVLQKDLVTGAVADKMDTTTPRFYVTPAPVEYRGRGEIWIQAKVNTDGAVVETKTVKNTTGSNEIAAMNESSLRAATFYPMVDKGTRKTFIYEYKVYY